MGVSWLEPSGVSPFPGVITAPHISTFCSLHLPMPFYSFETGSCCVPLAGLELAFIPPASLSASQVFGLQACTTTPSFGSSTLKRTSSRARNEWFWLLNRKLKALSVSLSWLEGLDPQLVLYFKGQKKTFVWLENKMKQNLW